MQTNAPTIVCAVCALISLLIMLKSIRDDPLLGVASLAAMCYAIYGAMA